MLSGFPSEVINKREDQRFLVNYELRRIPGDKVMIKKLGDLYDSCFYETYIKWMSKSAEIVLGLLYAHYKPQTIIDIGCGQGAWLAAAESFGAKRLKGIDGAWVRKDALLSNKIDFMAIDLEETMPKLNEKFDLCISVEVAEHIPKDNARSFIDLLCQASDTVIFSAAIKYQGGMNHINEQWQSYWIDLFNANGYECLDCFRGAIWNNESVSWWYRQNIFLFVGANNMQFNMDELRALEKPIFDCVHPLNYGHKISSYRTQIEYPTLQFCLRCIKCYIKSKLRQFCGIGA